MRALVAVPLLLLLGAGFAPDFDGFTVPVPPTWPVTAIQFEDVPLVKSGKRGKNARYQGTAIETWTSGEIRQLEVTVKCRTGKDGVVRGKARLVSPAGRRMDVPRAKYRLTLVNGVVTRIRAKFTLEGETLLLDETLRAPEEGPVGLRVDGWIGGGLDGWQTGDAPDLGNQFRGVFDSDDHPLSFDQPRDLFVTANGEICVADYVNRRISVWRTDGTHVRTIDAGDAPLDVFVDGDGNVYAATYAHRVMKWDGDGNLLGWIGGGVPGWHFGETPEGRFLGHLDRPQTVCVDAGGNLYVGEAGNHRVSKWDPDGNPVGWIGQNKEGWQTGDGPFSPRSSNLGFSNPQAIVVDDDGTLYIADEGNNFVSRWTADGRPNGRIGHGFDEWLPGLDVEWSHETGIFWGVRDVWRDADGNLYATEDRGDRVSKWDPDGVAIGWIGGGVDGWQQDGFPTHGLDIRSFRVPGGAAVGPDGTIYVADTANQRICRWNADGIALGWIGHGREGWRTESLGPIYTELRAFSRPEGVSLDPDGHLMVIDNWNERVCRWKADGTAAHWLGGYADAWQTGRTFYGPQLPRRMAHPSRVVVDAEGSIYVASRTQGLYKWLGDGTYVGWLSPNFTGWQTTEYEDGENEGTPKDVALDEDGNIYCPWGRIVVKWDAEGNFLGYLGNGKDGWRPRKDSAIGAFSMRGTGLRHFWNPHGIHRDANGDLYVTDRELHRVSRWDASGRARGWIGGGRDGWRKDSASEDGDGGGLRSFREPRGVFVDGDGRIWVADTENHRVAVWSKEGKALGWFGWGRDGLQRTKLLDVKDPGIDERSFEEPFDVRVTPDGMVYVADKMHDRVVRWRWTPEEGRGGE